jgi:hypothetical protein
MSCSFHRADLPTVRSYLETPAANRSTLTAFEFLAICNTDPRVIHFYNGSGDSNQRVVWFWPFLTAYSGSLDTRVSFDPPGTHGSHYLDYSSSSSSLSDA